MKPTIQYIVVFKSPTDKNWTVITDSPVTSLAQAEIRAREFIALSKRLDYHGDLVEIWKETVTTTVVKTLKIT